MELSAIQEFSLVGGTAMALRFGHRRSVDLDLFFHEKFNHSEIIKVLETTFGHRFVYKHHLQFLVFFVSLMI